MGFRAELIKGQWGRSSPALKSALVCRGASVPLSLLRAHIKSGADSLCSVQAVWGFEVLWLSAKRVTVPAAICEEPTVRLGSRSSQCLCVCGERQIYLQTCSVLLIPEAHKNLGMRRWGVDNENP